MKIRLTIAQRLWIGLGLLLSLLAAAYVFTLRTVSTLDAPLAQPADDVQARRAAAAEMQTRFNEVHQAVMGYLERRDSAQLASRKPAEARFDAALASYRRPGSSADGQALAQQVSERYTRYKGQADESVRAADAHASKQAALAGHAGELRRVAAFMPPATATKGRLRSAQKRETHKALAAQLAERAKAFGASGGAGEPIQPPKADSIDALLSRYNGLADTRVEREWVQRAQRTTAQGEAHVAALASAAQALERATAETSRLQRELDGLLTQRVQPAAKADATAMSDRTAGRLRAAGDLLSNGLLAALVLGALIALATSFAVRAPLSRLIASVRGYVDGDLSYRSLSMRGDEVGELRWIFDAMVGRLQNSPPAPPEPTPAPGEAAAAAPESLRYAAAAFEHAEEPMLVTDAGLRTMLVNLAFTRLTGHRLEDLQGKLPSMLWSPAHHDAAFVAALWAQVDEGGTWRGELWVSDKGGKARPLGVTIQAVRDADSRLLTTISTFRDNGARPVAERSATPLAYHDAPD
jgi:PAS domain S-box-containing protein